MLKFYNDIMLHANKNISSQFQFQTMTMVQDNTPSHACVITRNHPARCISDLQNICMNYFAYIFTI